MLSAIVVNQGNVATGRMEPDSLGRKGPWIFYYGRGGVFARATASSFRMGEQQIM
jgi:hypothetical protein